MLVILLQQHSGHNRETAAIRGTAMLMMQKGIRVKPMEKAYVFAAPAASPDGDFPRKSDFIFNVLSQAQRQPAEAQ